MRDLEMSGSPHVTDILPQSAPGSPFLSISARYVAFSAGLLTSRRALSTRYPLKRGEEFQPRGDGPSGASWLGLKTPPKS